MYNNDLYHYIYNLEEQKLGRRDIIKNIASYLNTSTTTANLLYDNFKVMLALTGEHIQ